MTRKVATLWKSNPSKNADAVGYSSAAVTYSSATTPYSSSTVGLDEFNNKLADSWAKQGKTPTLFVPNPAANTSLYLYDSAVKVYDSAVDTYDGGVAGQDFGDIETPTAWSET